MKTNESIKREYRVCRRCVMDTTDPDIVFDGEGVCNHCHQFDREAPRRWFPDARGRAMLEKQFAGVRKSGEKKEYDCILGLSGGVDSSYLALVLKDFSLRPLVVHVDAGWNSEVAVSNIEKIVKYCGYELYTHVMDWEEIRDLQLAYFKAGVANQDVVQDHAFFAMMYHFAVKNGIKYIISGGNIATEFVFPASWHHSAMDAINLHAIHGKHGSLKLKHYSTISFFQYYIYYPYWKKLKTLRPLNYLPYDKSEALSLLKEKLGYKEYDRKHGESRFTKFFQNYYLPVKFGFDKRRPHLSSMILSGQIRRNEALVRLEEPLYTEKELSEDRAYVAKKLGLSVEELELFIRSPGRSYKEYKNWDQLYRLTKKLQFYLEELFDKPIQRYS